MVGPSCCQDMIIIQPVFKELFLTCLLQLFIMRIFCDEILMHSTLFSQQLFSFTDMLKSTEIESCWANGSVRKVAWLQLVFLMHSILMLTRLDRCDAKQDKHSQQLEQLKTEMKSYLDQRLSDVPSQVAREVLKTVHVAGAVPLSEESVMKMMGCMKKKLQEDFRMMFQKLSSQIASINHVNVGDPVSSENIISRGVAQLSSAGARTDYDTFSWANPRYAKMKDQPTWHPVPKGFVTTKSNVFDGWILWTFGNQHYETENPPSIKEIALNFQINQVDQDLKSKA